MTWITESPWLLCSSALFLTIVFGLLYYHTQNGKFFLFAGIAAASGIAFFLLERAIVTEREGVQALVKNLAWNVRNNNMEGVLQHVAPGDPTVKRDIERLMPQCDFTTCFVSQSPVFQHLGENSASIEFPVLVSVRDSPYGKGNGKVDIRLDLVKIDSEWKIKDYAFRTPNSSKYGRW